MRTLYLPWMYYFKVVIVIILIFIIEIAIAITKPSLSTNKTENDKESSDTGSNQDNNDTIYFVFLRWIGICIFSVIVICLGYSICKCCLEERSRRHGQQRITPTRQIAPQVQEEPRVRFRHREDDDEDEDDEDEVEVGAF